MLGFCKYFAFAQVFGSHINLFHCFWSFVESPKKYCVYHPQHKLPHRSLLFQGLFSKCIVTIQKREKIEFGEKWHTENSIRIECFGTEQLRHSFCCFASLRALQVSMVARESFLILHLWLFSVEGKFLSSFAVDGTKSKIIGQSVKQNFDYLLQQTVIFWLNSWTNQKCIFESF